MITKIELRLQNENISEQWYLFSVCKDDLEQVVQNQTNSVEAILIECSDQLICQDESSMYWLINGTYEATSNEYIDIRHVASFNNLGGEQTELIGKESTVTLHFEH